ncbi:hypothetical protein XENTR_v10003072 [Xenopus tropicalis]|nr:hypothetical protein XENTR_v10003072 [Xenopus tropicalis]
MVISLLDSAPCFYEDIPGLDSSSSFAEPSHCLMLACHYYWVLISIQEANRSVGLRQGRRNVTGLEA